MKSERKEAAEIVRRLDDAATRAKRGRGLDALKDWDTAEFDGLSTRSSSGLEQLRHWDDAPPTSQVIPLTPLPLKDVPGISPTTPSLTATNPVPSETVLEAKRDLYQAEISTPAPLIQPAAPPVSSPILISQPSSLPTQQVSPPVAPTLGVGFSDRSPDQRIVSPLKNEPLQARKEELPAAVIPPSLKKPSHLGTGALQSPAAEISTTVKSASEGSSAPAVRLTGAMGAALIRNAAITQPRLSTLSSPGADGRSKNRIASGPRSYESSREPKLVTKPQPDRPALHVKADDAADFTPAQRAGINAGITIGTGLALAAVTVWLLVWFVSQSMSMVMDSLRAFVQ